MLNIHDTILKICETENVDPAIVLKRGRPSEVAKAIRLKAKQYMQGKIDINLQTLQSLKENMVKKVDNKPQEVNYNSPFKDKKFNIPDISSPEKTKELDEWVNSLSPKLRQFFKID